MAHMVDCPYCGLTFENNAEYVDVGFGPGIQVTGNVCERCGASEQGGYKDQGGPEIAFGWFPPAAFHYAPQGLEWLDGLIDRVFAAGVQHGYRHRAGAPADSLAPALAITRTPQLTTADVPF